MTNRRTMLRAFAIFALLISLVACSSEQATEQPYAKAREDPKVGPRLAATCLYTDRSSDDDPIVKPKPGMGHRHDFYGNLSTDQNSTLESLRAASSTCKQDDDLSAWWVPAASWGTERLKADKLVIYYQVTTGIDPKRIRPFPPGFEAIARDFQFSCGDGDFSDTVPANCSEKTVSIRLNFEQCFDPTNPEVEDNLTTPEREPANLTLLIRSLFGETSDIYQRYTQILTDAGTGYECPSTHPILLPQIQLQANYRIPDKDGPLQVVGNEGWGAPHADFINAWDQKRLTELVTLCLKQTPMGQQRPEVCRTAT